MSIFGVHLGTVGGLLLVVGAVCASVLAVNAMFSDKFTRRNEDGIDQGDSALDGDVISTETNPITVHGQHDYNAIPSSPPVQTDAMGHVITGTTSVKLSADHHQHLDDSDYSDASH